MAGDRGSVVAKRCRGDRGVVRLGYGQKYLSTATREPMYKTKIRKRSVEQRIELKGEAKGGLWGVSVGVIDSVLVYVFLAE